MTNDTFTVGQTKVDFTDNIQNCGVSPAEDVDLTGYLLDGTGLGIEFMRPDGTVFEKQAAPSDSTNLGNGEIKYTGTSESILDQAGDWSFRGVVRKADGTVLRGTVWHLFWVIA